jgi:hypothetical protein
MRKLIHSMGASPDAFIAGPDGGIDWSAPDEELHRFHNQQTRELGAHIGGRRLYEAMVYWEAAAENPSAPEHELEFARIWKDCRRSCSPRPSRESRAMPGWSGTALPARSPS